MWAQEESIEPMTWQEGMDHVKNLRLGGYSDWRLPTLEEFNECINYAKSKGYVDVMYEFFKARGFIFRRSYRYVHINETNEIYRYERDHKSSYWSFTTDENKSDHAWILLIDDGKVHKASKDDKYTVRAVRG